GYDSSVDCDDTHADVHPEQSEVCELSDQVDSDCNGDVNSSDCDPVLVDPRLTLYIDADNDNFGDADIGSVDACELVSGYASNSTDCDDTDPETYPSAPETCDLADQDCDGQIDEPELDEGSGCTDTYRDADGDGYGDTDAMACLCLYGDESSTVNPGDGEHYVVFDGDCDDSDSALRPRSCADGHDNDSDGRVPLVELDCDDDGSLPLLPLDGQPIDAGRHPAYAAAASYREAWTARGLQVADDAGLATCAGETMALSGCMGGDLTLRCDAGGTGLWMLHLGESSDGFGGRFEGSTRSYAAITGGRLTETAGDCDDGCPARYPGAVEGCDGIDSDCSDAEPGDDLDGVLDAVDPAVTTEGSVSLAEADADGDGCLDCDAFSEDDEQAGWSTAACEAITDPELLADFDDSDADVQEAPARAA
ncbi:MAG: hypothetical protein ACI8S6_005685, partial [Myxococcota bacterium]